MLPKKTRIRAKVNATTITTASTTPFGYKPEHDARQFDRDGKPVPFGKNVSIRLGDGTYALAIQGSGIKGMHRHMMAEYARKLGDRLFPGQHVWDGNSIKTNYTGGVVLTNDDPALGLQLRKRNPISDLMGSPIGAIQGLFHADPLIATDRSVKPVLVGIVRGDAVSSHLECLSEDEAVEYIDRAREIAQKRAGIENDIRDLRRELDVTDKDQVKDLREKIDAKELELNNVDPNQRYVGTYWAIPAQTSMSQKIDIDPVEDHVFGFWLSAWAAEFVNFQRYGGKKTIGGKIKWVFNLERYDEDQGRYIPLGVMTADPDADIPLVMEGSLLPYVQAWQSLCNSKKFFETINFLEVGEEEAKRAAKEKPEKKKKK